MSRVQVPSLTPEAQAPDQREHRKVRGFCVVWGLPAGARGRDLPGALLLRSAGPPPQTRGRAPRPHPPTDQQGGHPRVCGDEAPGGTQPERPSGPSPRLRGRAHERPQLLGGVGAIPASAGTSLVDLRFCRSKDPFSFSCEDLSVLCTVAAPTPLLPRSGKLSRPCTRMCSNLAEKATWARSPRNLSASGS